MAKKTYEWDDETERNRIENDVSVEDQRQLEEWWEIQERCRKAEEERHYYEEMLPEFENRKRRESIKNSEDEDEYYN